MSLLICESLRLILHLSVFEWKTISVFNSIVYFSLSFSKNKAAENNYCPCKSNLFSCPTRPFFAWIFFKRHWFACSYLFWTRFIDKTIFFLNKWNHLSMSWDFFLIFTVIIQNHCHIIFNPEIFHIPFNCLKRKQTIQRIRWIIFKLLQNDRTTI